MNNSRISRTCRTLKDKIYKPPVYIATTAALISAIYAGACTAPIERKTQELLNNPIEPANMIDIVMDTRLNPLKVYERGKTITILDAGVVTSIPIKYADATNIAQAINPLLDPGYTILADKKNNQLAIRFPLDTPQYKDRPTELESIVQHKTNNIQKLIDIYDIEPAQFRIQAHIMRIFASHADEVNTRISALIQNPKDAEDVVIGIDANTLNGSDVLRGAELSIGGILTRGITTYTLEVLLQDLKRDGYAEDLANPVLTVESGEKARISDILRFPTPEQVAATPVITVSKYQDVENFFDITPHSRADGRISLVFTAGVGEAIDIGEDLPNVNKRQIEIDRATVLAGQTYIAGGFNNRRETGSATRAIIGSGIKAEETRNLIVYFITAHYIDINKLEESNPDREQLEDQLNLEEKVSSLLHDP
jgi:type II secretory pathway component GspD/PulD (secretin)